MSALLYSIVYDACNCVSVDRNVCVWVCVNEYRECGGGSSDVWEWHVSVIDDDIVPAFPHRPFRRRFI
jgi:hypothetical protein